MADIDALVQRFSKSMARSGLGRAARIQVASRLEPLHRSNRGWSLAGLMGKTALLTGPARLSSALLLVHQAQRHHHVPLWIEASESTFFAPDAARMGIDLAALPLVRLPRQEQERLLWRILRRALSSEAFSLIVVDGALPDRRQAERLARTAAEHGTALLLLAPFHPGQAPRTKLPGGLGKVPALVAQRARLDASSFLAQIRNAHSHESPGRERALQNAPQAGIRLAALPELTIFH